MHVRLGRQLAHAGVDERDTRGALRPLAPPLLVVLPLYEVEFQVLRQVHAVVRRYYHHMPIELAEHDLAHPRCEARVCARRREVCAAVVALFARR